MKYFLKLFFIAVFAVPAIGQNQVLNVGVFAPVYLDSVFNGNTYLYKKNFPKFVLPGLEFMQGAEIALDSLHFPGKTVRTYLFDTRSNNGYIPDLIRNRKMDSLHLIIGAVKDMDFQELASYAQQKNIPFISATYPNDGGVSGNPFLVIMNSTLRAHCEAIHTYMLQSHSTDNLIIVRKPGSQEDRVIDYFRTANTPDSKPLLNLQVVNIKENDFSLLEDYLDSTKNNIVIGGSLDEKFSRSLIEESAALNSTYYIKLIGMPNWDNFTLSSKNKVPEFPVYFTTPYFNIESNAYARSIRDAYLKKYKGNPTDNAYKGFETVLLFTRLLAAHPHDFINHLNATDRDIFSTFNFKPVFVRGASTPDYFENKHLYFIRAQNKVASKAW